jgi:hypothetical protein
MTGERDEVSASERTISLSEAGAWVRPDVSYIDPVRRFCAYCGRPIARGYWQPNEGEDGKVYCDPAHAPAQATYPMSTDYNAVGKMCPSDEGGISASRTRSHEIPRSSE